MPLFKTRQKTHRSYGEVWRRGLWKAKVFNVYSFRQGTNTSAFEIILQTLLFSQKLARLWHAPNIRHYFILQEINFDSPRGGISLVTVKGVTTTSRLLIQNAKPEDSGEYSCIPSNSKLSTVRVHILNGKWINLGH